MYPEMAGSGHNRSRDFYNYDQSINVLRRSEWSVASSTKFSYKETAFAKMVILYFSRVPTRLLIDDMSHAHCYETSTICSIGICPIHPSRGCAALTLTLRRASCFSNDCTLANTKNMVVVVQSNSIRKIQRRSTACCCSRTI